LRNSIKEPTEYTIYDLFAPTSIFQSAGVKPSAVKVDGIVDYNGKIFIAVNQTKSIITAKSFRTTDVPSYIKRENLLHIQILGVWYCQMLKRYIAV